MLKQTEGIAWSVADGIGRITFCRSARANSISSAAGRALVQAIGEVLDARPRAVLLSGEGAIFCAGGDIDEFVQAGGELPALVDQILAPLHPAIHRLATGPAPVVAALNGPIGGAGVGLALCADFVLAAQSVKLRTGYAAIGLSPDLGSSYFLARRVGALRAQQWFLLSEAVDAARCLQYGVVDALYPDSELAGAAEALVQRLTEGAPESMANIKALCGQWHERTLEEQLALEHQMLSACARGANAREGVRAFQERRAPKFS